MFEFILILLLVAAVLIAASHLPQHVVSPSLRESKPVVYDNTELQSAIGEMKPLEETRPA